MDVSRAISQFVKSGRELFWLLRSEGQDVTPLDLHLLLTELFILQIEARGLKSPLRHQDQDTQTPNVNEQRATHRAPSITSMAAHLQVGDRLQALRDHYPVSLGAVGRVHSFRGMPGDWYVVVEWEKPRQNFSGEKMTNLWPISLKNFEVVPEAG
jgi:hypothetical protein